MKYIIRITHTKQKKNKINRNNQQRSLFCVLAVTASSIDIVINIDGIKINGFGRREDILLSSVQTIFACVCNILLSDKCIYK